MTTLFQSLGIVLSLIILIVVTFATLYLSYIIGIGILIAGLVFITYQLLKTLKTPVSPKVDLSDQSHFL